MNATPATAEATTTRDRAPDARRIDLYAPIHKALRSFMADTLIRVGRMDTADAAEQHATLAQLDQLLDLCTGHVHHENDFMHPTIEARAPAVSKRVADEHDEHLESIAELRAEAAALRAATDAWRAPLALRLYRHLALFVAANFQHMHIEESAHNAALWANYSDAELLALHERLLASLSPNEHLLVGRWMLPALTPAERAELVLGMQADAPPDAFAGLMAQLAPHLDAGARLKLRRDTGVVF